MSSFNGYEYISCILINNENTSSGNYLTLVKTTLLTGQCGVTVVASLPTNLTRDVTANIPISVHVYRLDLKRHSLRASDNLHTHSDTAKNRFCLNSYCWLLLVYKTWIWSKNFNIDIWLPWKQEYLFLAIFG